MCPNQDRALNQEFQHATLNYLRFRRSGEQDLYSLVAEELGRFKDYWMTVTAWVVAAVGTVGILSKPLLLPRLYSSF